MNIISRTNVTLANNAFGKSKDDDCQIHIGVVFIYQLKQDPKDIYTIHKIYTKPFPKQTGVIHLEDKNEIFSMGLDYSRILSFKLVPIFIIYKWKKFVYYVFIRIKSWESDLNKTKVDNILITTSL